MCDFYCQLFTSHLYAPEGGHFVKLISLDLQCFHRAIANTNEVWGRGTYQYITLFSPSYHSKGFPVTSPRFTELSYLYKQDRHRLEIISRKKKDSLAISA